MSWRGTLATLAVAGTLLAACGAEGTGTGVGAIQPREGRSGLHLTGTVGGRQVVVNDGAPVLRTGDCDVNDGTDLDLCFISREIDGGFFAVVVENPDMVAEGSVDVVDDPCRSPNCNHVTDGVVVEVAFSAGAKRTRATGGRMQFDLIEDGRRYAGTMNLVLPDGRVGGTFEVVPRPED